MREDAPNSSQPRAAARGIVFNFMVNSGGTLAQIAIALITVPVFIHHIGSARFGVLSLVWILLGYFGFLDLGLSRASANALGKLKHASRSERAGVLTTSFYLNLAIGLAGSLVIFLCGEFLLGHFMNLSGDFHDEVMGAFPWIVFMLPIGLSTGIFTGALESREHFVAANALQIVGYVLGQLLPLACVIWIGPELSVVIPATFVGRAVTLVITIATVFYYEDGFELRRFDRARSRELFRYGTWVTVTNLISPIMEASDRLLIGSLLGASAVSFYSVPMNLAMRALFIPGALGRTLFPRLSLLGGSAASELSMRATRIIAYSFAVVCAPAILLVGGFLALWVDPHFAAESRGPAEMLLVGVWFNGVAYIPFSLLQGQGRPEAAAKLHAVELLPFLGFLYLMTEYFGLVGTACAWSARVGLDGIGMLALVRCDSAGYLRLLPPCALLLVSYAATEIFHPEIVSSVAIGIGFVVVGLGMGVALEPDFRGFGVQLLSRLTASLPFRTSNAR